MSDATPGMGHNLPPLAELISPARIEQIIAAELDREPQSPEGGKIKSIRARDIELQDMCRRFLAAHPVIYSPAVEALATEVLSTLAKFSGGSGRIEKARSALKQPFWDAGVAIDAAFGKQGTQLVVRPLTGPAKGRRAAPLTLAEQINKLVADYKDAEDRRIRAEAQALADQKAAEAKMAEELARKQSSLVTFDDASRAAEEVEQARSVVSAPIAALTRSHGGEFGSTSRKRVRVFEIIDPTAVPRHLCVPSEQLIRAEIGQADSPMPIIPGISIRDETDLNRR